MTSPNEITVPQLSRLIGTPSAPVIIDVCIDDDFNADPRLIPTAFRHPHTDISSIADELAGRNVVVICQKGLKISQGAAAMLRTQGVNAENLVGGNFAWRDAGELMIPAEKIPRNSNTAGSLWVTRLRPKIDRIACPWLIRRFIDPQARFLFVSASQVMAVADKFQATAFDIEDTFWSHRGENCTFDTMLEEFSLQSKPLLHLATIIRGADTNRHDLAPEAAGLMAASLGLSRMYRDDLQQLEAGMLLYDSFYRWARDATQEGHDWPASASRR